MKTTILLTTVLAILGGCAVMVPGHLYPVQGPLSKENTPPIYTAALSGGILPSGSITVHIAAGITCPGDWRATDIRTLRIDVQQRREAEPRVSRGGTWETVVDNRRG